MRVPLEYFACGERQDRPELVLVQNSGHVDDDTPISGLDVFYEMDGRKSRYTKEVLDWYREEDARDLGRSELNELVESMTCFNPLEGEFWKSEKSRKKCGNVVHNIVMNEKFVKDSVMNAKIDPKVVMVLSIFKICAWNNLQPSNRHLLDECID